MPWLNVLLALLPIVTQSNHPQAQAAHQVIADAHAAAAAPTPPPPEHTVDLLTRALQLCIQAQAISGAPPTATTQALTAALAGLIAPK